MSVNTFQTDSDLLAEYSRSRSPQAFAELVARHTDWVYSAALRMVRDRHTAEDVSQAVFLLLSQRAAKIRTEHLNGWLFNVTRYSAANALRVTARRQKHERRAAMMTSEITETNLENLWNDLFPVLDQLVSGLRRQDRDAILLRFYGRKTMGEVALALDISEDAAKKRVAKAINNLRPILLRAGVVVPAAALATLLLSNTTHAAPAALAGTCAAGSVTAGAASIAKGATTMMIISKLKVAALIAAILLLPAGVGTLVIAANRPQASAKPQVLSDAVANAPVISPPAAPTSDAVLTPFLNSKVGLILSFDIASLDPAIVQSRVAAISYSDPASSQSARAMAGQFSQFIPMFKQTGAKQLYMMLEFRGNLSKNPVVVIPISKGMDTSALSKMMGPDLNLSTTLHDALVFSSDMNQLKVAPIEPRPDLAEALASSDSTLRAVFVPAMLRSEKTPSDLEIIGVSSTLYPEPLWDNVKWCLLEVAPVVDQASTATYKCKDHDSAVELARLLTKKTGAPPAPLQEGKWPNFFEVFRGSQIQVNDDRVEITLDQHAVDSTILGPMFGKHNP